MKNAAEAIKINNSAFKGDLVIDDRNQVKVIELTPRLSGGFDAQYRKPLSYNLNLVKYTMMMALNISFKPNLLKLNLKKYSSTFSVLFKPGKFSKFLNVGKLRKLKQIKKYFLLSKKNDIIENLTNCSQRNNFFISVGKNMKELNKIHIKIKSLLKVKYLNNV